MKTMTISLTNKAYAVLIDLAKRDGEIDIDGYARSILTAYSANESAFRLSVVAVKHLSDEERQMPSIYVAQNTELNRYYIGSTDCLRRRIDEHTGDLRAGKHHNATLQYDWAQCGENAFRWAAIEILPDADLYTLRMREYMWIRRFDKRYGHAAMYNVLRGRKQE